MEEKVISRSYRDLKVWQKAMDLVVVCYRVTENFPRTETYRLISQLQRASVSIPANIAEGQGRAYTKEFLQYLSVAYGSLMEVETHLQVAERLGYFDKASLQPLLENTGEIGRMLNGLVLSLKHKGTNSDS